jgi:EAL domain-containing protein (putative c-di-GMP-specific phosphodiesterase class I)
MAQLARWKQGRPLRQHLCMHVNICGRDLTRTSLASHVEQVLQRHQATPGSLTLELTETMLMGRLDVALRTMASLRASGVRFSIDDFGTGYSSLSYLGRLPIDSLKIDRSFVMAMHESRQNLEIVRAMLTLGRTLGHKVIAEGVETEDQLAMLRELGVHEGQGYLLARPMSAEQVNELFAASESAADRAGSGLPGAPDRAACRGSDRGSARPAPLHPCHASPGHAAPAGRWRPLCSTIGGLPHPSSLAPMPLSRLPPALRAVACSCALGLSTPVLTLLMMPPALLKLVVPAQGVRRFCDQILTALATAWVAVNNAWIAALAPRRPARLGRAGPGRPGPARLVPGVAQPPELGRHPGAAAHLPRPHPVPEVLPQAELIWVPVIGLAWWALDFPFMKRGKGSGARGSDLQTTRKACEKFKRIPTSVINFVEGTRFTPAKHRRAEAAPTSTAQAQDRRPGHRAGHHGRTVHRPAGRDHRLPAGHPALHRSHHRPPAKVIVRVQQRPIPADLLNGDPIMDRAYRRRLGDWVDQQWRDKDRLFGELRG